MKRSAMETLVLTIKDPEKKGFLYDLLSQLDYVEIKESSEDTEESKDQLFAEAKGMWRGKDIDADQLRKEAWKR